MNLPKTISTLSGIQQREGAECALSIENLSVSFSGRDSKVIAVDDVSLILKKGRVHALIGESGSGKSTIAFATAGLIAEGDANICGTVRIEGQLLRPAYSEEYQKIRGRMIGFVFQEPSTSLHPAIRIATQIREAIHAPVSTSQKKDIVLKLLEKVRLPATGKLLRSYPHELSGGMQQRVLLAIALANDPPVLFADEPTTALDPTTRRAILDQIRDNAVKEKKAILLITHDFGLVARYADEVSVLLKGSIVEQGETTDILRNAQHPYTRSLIQAVPHWSPGLTKPLKEENYD